VSAILRQNERMSPRGSQSFDSENPDVDIASGVLGNRTKALIVRHLWMNGPSRGVDIVKATGLQGPTFSLASQQLEEWGVVTGDLPREMRHGRSVTYTLNEERVRGLVDAWMGFISGARP